MNNLKKSKIIRFKKEELYAVFAIHRSFKHGPSLEIKKNYRNDSFFTLSSQNNILTSSKSLRKVINYLKKPYLKLVK